MKYRLIKGTFLTVMNPDVRTSYNLQMPKGLELRFLYDDYDISGSVLTDDRGRNYFISKERFREYFERIIEPERYKSLKGAEWGEDEDTET